MGRNFVDQVRQIGDETTAGVAVAGDRRLAALSITLRPNVDKTKFRNAGAKSTTATAINTTDAVGSYTGPGDYNHIIWPLESIAGSSGPTGAGVAKTRVYTPATYGPDSNAKTFTVEAGDNVAARVYSRLRFRSFQLRATRRTGSTVSGECGANYPTDGNTLTASPTDIARATILGKQWDVYLDPTFGAIGTTKIVTAYDIGFAVGTKYAPFYALNSSNGDNMADEAEIPHDINGMFAMMHDAQSRSLFAGLLNNDVVYLRYVATGAILEGVTRQKIQFDIAAQLFINEDDADENGTLGQPYGFDSVYDSALGGHWKATVINSVASI
jgi:hypothetical protein